MQQINPMSQHSGTSSSTFVFNDSFYAKNSKQIPARNIKIHLSNHSLCSMDNMAH